MKNLAIQYDESVLAPYNLSVKSFEEEAKLALAMKLFEMGRLTSGQAATIAGISRVEFLLSAQRFSTPSVQWDHEELEAEFADIPK